MEIDQKVMKELSEKIAEIWTQGKIEYIDQIFSEDLNYELNNIPSKGKMSIKTHLNKVKSAFKNLSYTVLETFYVEDRVIQRWSGKGTFATPYQGLTPTQKPFEYGGMTMIRIRGNKITDMWVYNNLQEALEQTQSNDRNISQL